MVDVAMAEGEATADGEEAPPKKKGMLVPLILGLVLAGAGGGGGFFAVQSGLLGGESAAPEKAEMKDVAPFEDVAFVPLEPIFVALGPTAQAESLRFRAELEVPKPYEADVLGILPRIVDVLNGYLRAVDPVELEEPTTLMRLRAQMLRRVQVVAGEGRIRDLLVMEFVVN